MADRNQLKIADQVDLTDDDPFAELTRIMGFDPRQPVRPAAAQNLAPTIQPVAEPVEELAAEDDFSIDLEKELMGEFGADDDAGEPMPAARHEPAAPEISADDTADKAADTDFDLADGFDDAMAASVAKEADGDDGWMTDKVDSDSAGSSGVVVDASAATVDVLEEDELDLDFEAALADVDLDFGSDPDAEPAAAAEDEDDLVAAAPDAQEDTEETELSLLDEDELLLDEDDLAAEIELDLAEDEAEPALVAQDEADEDDLAAEIELDLAEDEAGPVLVAQDDADEDDLAAEIELDLAEDEAEPALVAKDEADEDDLAAEIELDLAEDEDGPALVAQDEAEEDDLAAEIELDLAEDEASPALVAQDDADDADLRLFDEDRLDLDADDSLQHIEIDDADDEAEPALVAQDEADEPDLWSTDATPAQSTTQDADDTAETLELSLEDELNALLGNSAPAKTAAVIAARGDSYAEADGDPMEIENLAEDLNWELEDEEIKTVAEPIEDDEPVLFAEGDAIDEDSGTQLSAGADDGVDDAVYAALQNATADLSDDLPDFDHDAFDAALARGFDAGNADEMAGSDEPEFDESVADEAPVGEPVRKEDPLDVIAALAAKYATPLPSGSYSRVNNVAQGSFPAERRQEDADDIELSVADFDEAPDVETVDVADKAVALADDLDIPELEYDEELPPVSAYDDLDAEFASLLSDMNAGEAVPPRPAAQAAGAYDDDFGGDFVGSRSPAYAQPVAAGAASAALAASHASTARPAYDDDPDQGQYDFDADNLPGSSPMEAAQYDADDFEYDPELDEAISVPDMAAESARPQRRGMLVAAIVGGVAIVGGLGAFALSFGAGAGSDVPAIVKADDSPIKVKPKNPGGTTVPNQDSKVYDTVAGEGTAAEPQQEKLVTTAEEPVIMVPPIPEPRAVEPAPAEGQTAAVASPKGEDRIEQILQEAEADADAEIAAVAPRKVRTMVVKPDGTLVPREDPAPVEAAAPAPTAAEAVATAPEIVEAPAAPLAAPESTASVPQTAEAAPTLTPPSGEAPVPVEAPAAVEAPRVAVEAPTAAVEAPPAVVEAPVPVEVPAAVEVEAPPAAVETPPAVAAATPEAPAAVAAATAEAPAASETQSATTPDTVPIAPQRPAEQPIDVVGEVKADQVAAIAPSAAAATGATWSMQIASQPSEAAAQSSYQDLARRYGGVLGGHEVNIVKAEIPGKGTFWRVRVPAKSRNDAIGLCESYKAAGGNCFVSR